MVVAFAVRGVLGYDNHLGQKTAHDLHIVGELLAADVVPGPGNVHRLKLRHHRLQGCGGLRRECRLIPFDATSPDCHAGIVLLLFS